MFYGLLSFGTWRELPLPREATTFNQMGHLLQSLLQVDFGLADLTDQILERPILILFEASEYFLQKFILGYACRFEFLRLLGRLTGFLTSVKLCSHAMFWQ